MYVSRDRGTRNCEFSGASEGGRGQIKGAHYLSSTWLRSTVDDGLESRGKFRSNKASSTLQNLGASQSGLRVLFGGTQASRGPSALPLCSEASAGASRRPPRTSTCAPGTAMAKKRKAADQQRRGTVLLRAEWRYDQFIYR